MPWGSTLLAIGATVVVGSAVFKVIKDFCAEPDWQRAWRAEEDRRDRQRSLERKLGNVSQAPGLRPLTTANEATLHYEYVSYGAKEYRICRDCEDGGETVKVEEFRVSKGGNVSKSRSTLPSPRAVQSEQGFRERRFEQRLPRTAMDELDSLIDLQVARSESERKKGRPGSMNRNTVSNFRERSDAAMVLSRKAFEEGRKDDGRQLIAIRDELNAAAAREIYASHNSTTGNGRRCDVHGLFVSEARDYVGSFLENCIKRGFREVTIITGKGIHSGVSGGKLRPAILAFLNADPDVKEAKVDEKNEGCILVRLK